MEKQCPCGKRFVIGSIVERWIYKIKDKYYCGYNCWVKATKEQEAQLYKRKSKLHSKQP